MTPCGVAKTRERVPDREQVAHAEEYVKEMMGNMYQFGFDCDPVGWVIARNKTTTLWLNEHDEEKWRYFAFHRKTRPTDLRVIRQFQEVDLV